MRNTITFIVIAVGNNNLAYKYLVYDKTSSLRSTLLSHLMKDAYHAIDLPVIYTHTIPPLECNSWLYIEVILIHSKYSEHWDYHFNFIVVLINSSCFDWGYHGTQISLFKVTIWSVIDDKLVWNSFSLRLSSFFSFSILKFQF